jgi:outer membrane murein-binding lipoprotein Lpp
MGNLWILLVAPVAILGAWLFMTVHDEQKAEQKATQVEMQRDRAEFDKDFSKAWNGKPNPELEKRAAELNTKLSQVEADRAKAEAEAKTAQEKEKKELEALLNGGRK